MNRYMIRRLLQFIPVVIGTIALLFVALYIIPGDPVQSLVGERPVTPAFRQAVIDRYGLDDPLPVQIGRYVGNIFQLDFGESAANRRPVFDIIKERVPVTFRLAMSGAFFLIVLGIGTGVIAAVKKYSFADASVTLMAIVLVSVPVFVLGVLLQIFVALKLKSVLGLPITGLETWKSYILPGFVLASVSMAYVSRLQRTSLLETLQADYVRTARAKGLTERRVVFNHAWRNALIPVVTYLGIDIGTILGGAILTETVFNINGLGRTLALGITQQDNQVVLGVATFIVLVYLVANLAVDLLYAVLDPRIRYE
jgi:peptide/nickel transport system permease protein/oligopeptide transport system permease protein